MDKNKALLIIDMQKGSFTPDTPRYDTDGVVKRMNTFAQIFRKSGYPVIFIQHDGTKTNEFVPNTIEWEILDELKIDALDILINKYANDAFYKSTLESKLKDLRVDHLFITGCATDFCVASTIQSGLIKDYKITVVKDCHTTGNRPHLKAKKVIEHYNWVWQNMIPTNNKIEVKTFEQLKKEIKVL